MGIGDDLMWRAEAYHEYKRTGKKQRPYRKKQQTYGSEIKAVWQNTPWLDFKKGEAFETHPNNNRRWYSSGSPYRPKVAPIDFTDMEEMFFKLNLKKYGDYVLINPDAKRSIFADNKKYFRWQEVVDLLQDYTLLRAKPNDAFIKNTNGQVNFTNLTNIPTNNVREAMVMVKYAKLVVTTEGGLHHAAGQMGVPCIVLYGSHQSPFRTGYQGQINITRKTHCNPDGLGCHVLKGACQYCEQAMDSIEPEEVAKLVRENYDKDKTMV